MKTFAVVLILVALLANVATVFGEPSLDTILDSLGFSNRIPVSVETFSPGAYEVTLYAEWAGYRDSNMLHWYKVGTNNFTLILDGPEGVPSGHDMGPVTPPLVRTFIIDSEFGLSLLSPDHDSPWFTQTSRNSDGRKHANVYQSLDDANLFFIGFENLCLGSSDFDYNDMVISLKHLICVGGEWTSINRLTILAPWIGTGIELFITISFASVVCLKQKKKKQD